MMRQINEAYWHDYYNTHNNRHFDDLVARFFAEDAVFENPKVRAVGHPQILDFFTHSNQDVHIKLVPHAIIINPGVTATELDCVMQAQRDLPEFLITPLKKGGEVTVRMAAVYHLSEDLISRAGIYWGQRVK